MNELFRALAQEPYEPRGIIHSEIALIIYTVRRCGVTRIIESGRARGQSTYLLSKYLPDVKVHSVELRGGPDEEFGRQRLAGVRNVMLHCGDGRDLVPRLARGLPLVTVPDEPTAILCDGPKGAAAVTILEQCFTSPDVRVGFIHDMRRLDHGGPSPHRADAIARLPNHFFSDDFPDDPRVIARLAELDANVVSAGGPCGPDHEAVFGSYGPTLGVFLNPQ